MSKILTITKKELWSYFSNPTAILFLGAYLLQVYLVFLDRKVFYKPMADLRPLFEMTLAHDSFDLNPYHEDVE